MGKMSCTTTTGRVLSRTLARRPELRETARPGERAARSPGLAVSRNSGLLANVRERTLPVVVVQDIFPIVRHVKIFEPIVVVVAHAHALAPSCMPQTRFL